MVCTETNTKRMIVIELGPFGLRVKLPPVYHEQWIGFTLPHLNAERQAEKLQIPNFEVFDLTRLGIEPKPTISVADTLFNQTLFGICATFFLHFLQMKLFSLLVCPTNQHRFCNFSWP